jgi:hypothetical protein
MKLIEMALLVSVGITLQEYFITYYVEHYFAAMGISMFSKSFCVCKKECILFESGILSLFSVQS